VIYGINFRPKRPEDGPVDDMGFPPGYAKKFRKTCRLAAIADDGKAKVVTFRLVGICESRDELHQMLIQADNGRRHLHTETRKTGRGPLFGVYAY